jgi:hypothetical protein
VLTRRQLLGLVLAGIIAFVIAAVGQSLVEFVRLQTGPNSWYAIGSVPRLGRQTDAFPPIVFGGPFQQLSACNSFVRSNGDNGLAVCERMLDSDAERLEKER